MLPAGIDIHPMTLEINFKIPFMREFLLLHGVVDASKSACLMTLGKGSGQAILLAVGGAQESLLARPGTYDIVSRVSCSAVRRVSGWVQERSSRWQYGSMAGVNLYAVWLCQAVA
jgi:hypothetical protein